MTSNAISPKNSFLMHRIPFPTSSIQNKPSSLRQELNLFNLVMTGVAGTTFVIMVMSGVLVGDVTGTSAFLCFLVAAIVTIFPGVCFVELTTRMPSAGSVYTYTYATVGECIAFLIGWNNFWDFVFQAALAAKSISDLIDRMSFGVIRDFFVNALGKFNKSSVSHDLFDDSPDIAAALLLLLICIVLIFSVDISITTLNIMAAMFLGGFLVVVISCFVYGSPDNLVGAAAGPFLTHGFNGIFKGASIILFAYMFYEAISVASEEATKPIKDVPRASLICLIIVTVFLITASLSISYLQPRYVMDIKSPFISGFQYKEVKWLVWFTFGVSILALVTNCLATLYASSRYLYAMARDGILPTILAHLLRRFQSPVVALSIATFFAVILAIFFNLVALSKMSQLGSVLSFFIIGVDLIVVRYMPSYASTPVPAFRQCLQIRPFFKRFFPIRGEKTQHWIQNPIFFCILLLIEIVAIFLATIVFTLFNITREGELLWVTGAIASVVALMAFIMLSTYQPNDVPEDDNKPFIVPLLPIIPILAISLSLTMATSLPAEAWVRLVVLSLFGYLTYFIQILITARAGRSKVAESEPDEEMESECSSPLISESSISRRNSLE